MRTYNQQNTSNVKQARKQSKELRKLKMNKGNAITFTETNSILKGQQNSEQLHCSYDDVFVYEGDW